MKKIHNFSKAFLGCAIFSALVIVLGIAGIFVKGINFGIDFEPGLLEEVRVAPTAIEVNYAGPATVTLDVSATGIDVVISGTGAENETRTFTFGQNPTVSAIAESLNTVDGITARVRSSESADSYSLFTNSAATSRLSSDVSFRLYAQSEELKVTIDDIRATMSGLNVSVKELGTEDNRSFQIRAKATDESATNQKLQEEITSALQNKFGSDNVAIIKTDFVGSTFSKSLMLKSILLAVLTILLIWVYATVRFHWDFALGAVVALIHDFLIMFTFISWFQIEFSSTTLAAVLTIFGYSINATVVILDRVRANLKNTEAKKFTEVLDKSLSETLSRSIITTITTLFASVSLWVFTDGAIETFAIVLTIGLISGCYSSMFISSGFIALVRRHWEPGENAERVRPRKETAKNLENK